MSATRMAVPSVAQAPGAQTIGRTTQMRRHREFDVVLTRRKRHGIETIETKRHTGEQHVGRPHRAEPVA